MPGPGQFNVSDDWSKKMKGTGFGNSKRNSLGMSKDTPGPGNYSFNGKD